MTLKVGVAPFGKSIVLFYYHVCFVVRFVALSSNLSCYSIIKHIVPITTSIVFFYCRVHFMLLARLFRCSICCSTVQSLELLYHRAYCLSSSQFCSSVVKSILYYCLKSLVFFHCQVIVFFFCTKWIILSFYHAK